MRVARTIAPPAPTAPAPTAVIRAASIPVNAKPDGGAGGDTGGGATAGAVVGGVVVVGAVVGGVVVGGVVVGVVVGGVVVGGVVVGVVVGGTGPYAKAVEPAGATKTLAAKADSEKAPIPTALRTLCVCDFTFFLLLSTRTSCRGPFVPIRIYRNRGRSPPPGRLIGSRRLVYKPESTEEVQPGGHIPGVGSRRRWFSRSGHGNRHMVRYRRGLVVQGEPIGACGYRAMKVHDHFGRGPRRNVDVAAVGVDPKVWGRRQSH